MPMPKALVAQMTRVLARDERIDDVAFLLGVQPAVKRLRPIPWLCRKSRIFSVPSRVSAYTIALPVPSAGKALRHNLIRPLVLFGGRHRLHLEDEVLALDPAGEIA